MADRLSAYADWLVANKSKQGSPEFTTVADAYKQLRQQTPAAPAPDQPQPPKYVNPDIDGPFEGLSAAFQQGVDAPFEAMGTTAEALGSPKTAAVLRGATSAPKGYQSATGQFMSADGPDDFAFRYLPKAVVEQTGQVAGSIASRTAGAVGGGLLGSLMGPKGTIAGTAIGAFAGPAVFEGLQILGPTAIERAKNNGRDKPTSEDWQAAYATAAASGALNAIAPNTQGILKRLLIEGTTEATQSGVQQTGETLGTDAGLQVSPKEMLGEGLLGAGAQVAVDTAIRTTKGTAAKLFNAENGTLENPDTLPIATQQAGATFARRIDKIAREGDLDGRAYDLQDLDKMSQGGARAVIEASHTDLVGEIKNQSALLREQLRPNDQDTFDQRYLKVRAAVAEKMARNKTKSVVTNENFKALEELVGEYTEGQALMNLIRESQIMTEIHNGDYQGQLSKITDKFAVFGAGLGYDKSAVAVEQVVRPIASMAFGYNTFGLSLLGQQALATIGTKIDKSRGTYSSVDSFIKANKDKTGLPAPRPPSVREGRLQQAQAATQSSEGLEAFRRSVGGPELDNSPVGTITLGTGLDVSGLTQLLDQIESLNSDNADVMDRVDQTRRNIAGENNQISDLTTWVSALNGVLNSDAALDALRSNDPDQGNARNARRNAGFGGTQGNQQQQQQQAPQQGPSAAVQSGIDANNALADRLLNGMESDQSIPDTQKKLLRTALLEFGARTPDGRRGNIGANGQPLENALAIVERLRASGVMPRYINNYIMPYVQRVAQQDAGRSGRQQPPTSTGTDLALDEDFAPRSPDIIDNKSGLGQVPYNMDVDYRGARVLMKPSTFATLASSRNGEPAVQFVKEHLQQGGKIGAPFLQVDLDNADSPKVTSHEGRSRMLGVLETYGDVPIEVHLFPLGKRARDLSPTMIKSLQNNLVGQDGNTVQGPLFSPAPTGGTDLALDEDFETPRSASMAQVMHEEMYESSPKMRARRARELGLDITSKQIRELLKKRGKRRGQDFDYVDPLIEARGSRKSRTPTEIEKLQARKAETEASIKAMQQKFADERNAEIERYEREEASRKATRDNLLAAARQARKLGRKVRSSSGRDGKISSYYVSALTGPDLRISDHEIPANPRREFMAQENGRSDYSGYYGPELIVGDTTTDTEVLAFLNGTDLALDEDFEAPSQPAGPDAGQSFDQDLTQQRGSLGALATPEPQPQFNIKSLAARMMGSQPANPAQVKAQLAFVRPAFEIGKAGTKYADGIQDIESAKKFANAINVTLNLFDSQQEMFDAMGRPLTDNAKGIRGAYSEIGRDVFGLNAGAQNETLGPITDLYSLTTILHELGHAVAKDSGFEGLIGNMESGRPTRAGSLPTQAVRKRVSSEINNIQKNVDIYLEKNPKDRRPVRRLMAALQARKDSPEQTPRVNRFLAYINRADERSVDPVLLYFVNPRLAKAVAPTTSKLVRESLNASGNQNFQLYTYPFATIVAVVLAMLANGRAEEEEEEEKRKQQMQQQGALSQQQGALSQQQAA